MGKINMKTIGVYTQNFSLYYDLLKVLRNRKIPYVSLSSKKYIPKKIGVILTSHNELHDFKTNRVIAVDVYDDINHVIDIAIQMIIGKNLYSQVYIGIDPGDKPGIAVVGDDLLLKKTSAENPEKIKSVVKRYLSEYPAIQTIIRIGHGSPLIRNRIINNLIPLKIPIEIVDETSSSSQKISRNKRDSESAAAIAFHRGGEVQKKLPIKPTNGEIKNIQERSRKLTNGKYSISKKIAIDVLKGKISLDQAIGFERNSKKQRD
jgi:hypothetical protein